MTGRRLRSIALGSVIGLVAALIVVWALGAFGGSDDAGNGDTASGLPKVPNLDGKSVPNDTMPRFDGSTVSLNAYLGRPLVVNFWAASCAPCVKEMPAFEQAHQLYGSRVQFLGIQTAENLDDGKEMIAKTAITYATARDPQGSMAAKLGAVALPTTVWVSAEGKVVDIHLGALTYDELTSRTNKLFGDGEFVVIYAFTVGMLATVNPCGFAMLPAYLSYFLGIDGHRPADDVRRVDRQVGRALIVGPTVSLGFMSVFLVLGGIVQAGATWINTWLRWATIGIGLGLVVLGIAMLRGYHLPFATPRLDRGGKDRSLRSLFVFGVSYGVASISCGIQLFLAVVFEAATANGFLNGVGRFVAYGAGMGVILTALTVSMALARQGLLRWLRIAMQWIDRIAGVLLILTGAYLVYYWIFNIVTEQGTRTRTGSGLIDRVESLQSRLSNELNNWGGRTVGIVLGTALVAAVVFVIVQRRHSRSLDTPKQ